LQTNPLNPIDPSQGAKLNEEQRAARQEMDMVYQAVFGTPQGQRVLADLKARMEAEDVPMYNMPHVNEYMHYCSGRRSVLKYFEQIMKRIQKG